MVIGTPTVLNLIPGGVMKVIHVNQVNENIEIQFRIMNGAQPFNVPEGVSCTIRGTKGDNFGYAAAVAVTAGSNIVTVTLTEQLTAVAGAGNIFELVFVGASDDMKVSTENFILAVERAALGEDTVISDSDLAYADQVLDQLQSVGAVNAQVQQNTANIAAETTRATAAEAAEASARQAADQTLQQNINAEASSRATTDASLQAQIDQLIAPSGSAPSAAEVENARIGSDGTVYPTLGDAIRTQNSDLKSQIVDNASDNIFDNYVPVTGKYYDGTEHTAASYNYYVVPVLKGVKYMVLPKMRMHVIKQGNTTVVTDLTDKKTSFTPTVNGTAYITIYASDTPALFVSNTDKTLTVVGKPADAKETGSMLMPTYNHSINYDYTVFASEYVEGKYYGTDGAEGASSTYNYYAKIPVVSDNTYLFSGRGARFVVLYKNSAIVQTAENATVFTAEYDGEMYVTEYASDPLAMYLYNDYHKISAWTNKDVNGYVKSTSDSSNIYVTSTSGDVMHLKLNGYSGSHFTNFVLYAVVNGNNTIVASLYSPTDEVVFVAPTATRYMWYINQSQSETATFGFELTNYSQKTIFNSLDKLNVSDRFKSDIYGKKIACLGDSFTYGVATYVAKMNSRYLSKAINYGVASSRIVLDSTSSGTTIQSFLNRYAGMDNDAEIVTVFGGINDAYDIGAGVLTLGNINSPLNTATFYGGLKLLVTNLMKKYPAKQIIGIVPPDCQSGQYYIDNLPDVQQAERDVYNMYGIPVIDIKKECFKMSTLQEMVALYRGSSTDIHPSQAGQEALCDTISAGIKRIVI